MSFVLAAVLIVIAVAGAEFVRSLCRRRLLAPVVATIAPRVPVEVGATAEVD